MEKESKEMAVQVVFIFPQFRAGSTLSRNKTPILIQSKKVWGVELQTQPGLSSPLGDPGELSLRGQVGRESPVLGAWVPRFRLMLGLWALFLLSTVEPLPCLRQNPVNLTWKEVAGTSSLWAVQ